MSDLEKVLILTDNKQALDLARELHDLYGGVSIAQSPNGSLGDGIPRMNARTQSSEIISRYNLVISIHCKQFFPANLVRGVRCVNVHPGYNPHNRGWYPHVFSIINGLPAGVTIHEIDERLDHGPIIVQREHHLKPWDTSDSAYSAIMAIERELVLEHFEAIVNGTYKGIQPGEGNLNLIKDFEALKCIDLNRRGTFGEFLNHLRALTHKDFKNAYFLDADGRKVFVRIVLQPDSVEAGQ